MELLIIVVIAFFVGKMFGSKGKQSNNDGWPDEPVEYTPPKKNGCSSCLISLAFWGFVLIAFAVLISILSGESVDVGTSSPSPSFAVSAPADPTATPTAKPTPSPTPSPTPEPNSLQGWAEYVAQAEFGRFDSPYTNLISVDCEQVDGESAPMIIINAKYPSSFGRNNDDRMSGFLFNVMNVTWKLDELAKAGKIEYGSVFIHGRTTFADKYGNETEGDAAQIRIKASEAAKVNWSYSTVTGDMMPGIAASFGIHPVIRDGLSISYYNKIRK